MRDPVGLNIINLLLNASLAAVGFESDRGVEGVRVSGAAGAA